MTEIWRDLHYHEKEGVKNAAPIGIVCKGKNKLGCRLFVGTKTLKNIMETMKYVVNIIFIVSDKKYLY